MQLACAERPSSCLEPSSCLVPSRCVVSCLLLGPRYQEAAHSRTPPRLALLLPQLVLVLAAALALSAAHALAAAFPPADTTLTRPFGAASVAGIASKVAEQRPAASAAAFAAAARVAAATDATASRVAHCADRGDYRIISARWETAIRTRARGIKRGHTPHDAAATVDQVYPSPVSHPYLTPVCSQATSRKSPPPRSTR